MGRGRGAGVDEKRPKMGQRRDHGILNTKARSKSAAHAAQHVAVDSG